MQVDFYNSADLFLKACGDFLRQHEVEHNVILSICAAKGEGTAYAALFNDDGIVMAAVQAKGHNLVLSRNAQGDADIRPLAERLFEARTDFQGVVGPSDVVTTFVDHWTALSGQRFDEFMDQIIYTLKTVCPPAKTPEGVFRAATEKDIPLIAGWIMQFCKDALSKTEQVTPDAARARAERGVKEKAFYVWDVKGKPVAQAGYSGTPEVARVSFVYTPAEERGKGYAGAVVASLSQARLDAGQKLCCLYADARNPVSNSIYRKIGYVFTGRSSHYARAA
jgi:predicted GNAT family acetyltransferase